MKDRQEAHLQRVKALFLDLVNAKYRAGAVENDDTLLEMRALHLVDEAMNECVDQFVYLQRLKEVLQKGKR